MEIKLDGAKILKEIFELDGTIHTKIKEEVRSRLIDKAADQIEEDFFKNSWGCVTDEIKDSVLEEVSEMQEKAVKKILKDFYDSYRYGKKDLTILKKLKELIGEN